eukprot:scpid57347/ scgid14607/ Transposon Ty3-G Gag-Pol polyprotein; Gag3-Pol3; Transposon Ty3-1 TYA-TYB polyprotein; Capsid protein; p24; Spacer peptide p3; Nucleocapsid protein p11; Ty3 protease; p16; Spacer peptide J; Reverse transcriptase/ribonuclease H; p55; Integrase p61; Integrase p58
MQHNIPRRKYGNRSGTYQGMKWIRGLANHTKIIIITRMVSEFSDLFWVEGDKLPTIRDQVCHEIRLKPGATPAWSRPRRLHPEVREEVRKEVDYLEKQGLIRPSVSPWAAPIVAARRKNGKIRLAMDYRRLNEATYTYSRH